MSRLPYEFFIALRYLRAKKRHKTISLNTFISIAGVGLGVAALIATLAVMTGFKEDLRDKILGTNAHIILQDNQGKGIADYEALLQRVQSVPHVLAAAPFIHREVMLVSQSRVAGVVLRGIDLDQELRVTDLGKNMKAGRIRDLAPASSEDPKRIPGIVIGEELAHRLGVFVGDTLNLVSPLGPDGPMGVLPRFKRFAVVGIFDSGMYEYDSSLAYIPLLEAQKFFDSEQRVSAIQIRVDNIFKTREIAPALERAAGSGIWARDWMEMNRNLFSALQLEKIVMFIILVLIVLVAAFNIIGTLTMIVMEKGREISILKAMGATRWGIMKIFMIDGLIIGGVGTALGAPLGYGISLAIEKFYTLPADVYYLSHVPVRLQAMDMVLVIGSAIGISFLATLYPSWQAAKLDPAEGLRYE